MRSDRPQFGHSYVGQPGLPRSSPWPLWGTLRQSPTARKASPTRPDQRLARRRRSLHYVTVSMPATDLSAAQISVKLTPGLPPAAPGPCASDQPHDARRDGKLGPRSGGAPFRRAYDACPYIAPLLGSPPCARQTTTAPWPQRILGAVKLGAYAGKQSRITNWPSRGWPRCLPYGHDENILRPYATSIRVAAAIVSSGIVRCDCLAL